MKTIDIHAHIVPDSMWRAIEAKQDWHGFRHEPGEGLGTMVACGQRTEFSSPKVRYTVEERIRDMDTLKVDVQVLSIHTPFVGYHLPPEQGLALARDFNDELGATVRKGKGRLAGFATLPVQDTGLAIAELERAVTQLGLKGASLDTQVNAEQWDEPRFLPFFKAAEQLGAVLFYHPQPRNNFLADRIKRHGLNNSLGVILDDAIVTAVLICGGVLEKCPDLKICIAHGGGPACYAMGRLDRNWHDRPVTRSTPKPPSAYQTQLYYDTVTGDETALRFLIDQVGADRVVMGSDWPFVPWHPSPVTWLENRESLTAAEKEKILWKNLAELLDIR
ncbi:MAG: amidohydrolase [Betaproteobacteria bacterium]|jgi:aminocarboxymuconate-semialdehyde decarboxylase|nr:amidohydrolase [Betaproteobacteria bacterium]MDH4293515.1 amidohydrolase [Betaproteobacteria bacterium]MDH5342518.1 amidohydrolase [Betaproteobacteria bacterium]